MTNTEKPDHPGSGATIDELMAIAKAATQGEWVTHSEETDSVPCIFTLDGDADDNGRLILHRDDICELADTSDCEANLAFLLAFQPYNAAKLLLRLQAAETRARKAESERDESNRIRCELADRALAEAQRARKLEEALKEAADALAIEARANEMSANIMRDRRRTGGWEGAERTAAAFDRHGLKAAGIRAKLLNALTTTQEA